MTQKEMNTLKRIPKAYREHITELTIRKSGCFNDIGHELNDYTVTWDNGDEHTFQNIEMMIYLIKENTVDGYYVA